MGSLQGATCFNALNDVKQLGRSVLADRPLADMRENIAIEAADDPITVRGDPIRGMLLVPLAGYRFETVRDLQLPQRLLRFAVEAGAMTSASCLRAALRWSRASLRPTPGYAPEDSSFSFPSKRYFRRRHLPPPAVTRRNRSYSSKSLAGFGPDLALRIAMSVRGVRGEVHHGDLSYPAELSLIAFR